jgi:hypothetical protein
VKLIRTSKDRLLFHLGKREKELLFRLLMIYPRIPAAHQPLSKSGRLPDQPASQRLLDEALAEHRAENKKQLQVLLADPARLAEDQTGWRLSLSSPELEWLLQVLNDVRVGSWVILGSPEQRREVVNAKTAPHLWAMEMAGAFQMEFLEAMENPGSNP